MHFSGCSQTWCSAFYFVASPLYTFRAKLQPNKMRNNVVFTPLMFQDNSFCIFVDIHQKVKSRKFAITLMVDTVLPCSTLWSTTAGKKTLVDQSTPLIISFPTTNSAARDQLYSFCSSKTVDCNCSIFLIKSNVSGYNFFFYNIIDSKKVF